jgi:hypothetical protein
MKDCLARLRDAHKGQGHINYFQANLSRMQYNEYREGGFPIGSGLVEGGCKFVIAKRFKGSGMRWKKADNEAVLIARLAKLNGLPEYFVPKPREWSIRAAKAA